MKRLLCAALALVLAMSLIACGGKKPETVTLKIGHSQTENDPYHKGVQKFADLVKEKTNGAVVFEVYPNSSLGSENDMYANIATGVQDAGLITNPACQTTVTMSVIEFPYGKGHLSLELPKERILAVLESDINTYDPGRSQKDIVEEALRNPIGSPGLAELSRGKKKVTIIASDHTRPVPSKYLIPPMLREIRKGNPEAEITILVATGCHRTTKQEELIDKFGAEIVEKEHIIVHNCDAEQDIRLLGTLPSGGECVVNRWACEADLLVSEGFIEPHFFAGYSGGRKSVLPGCAGRAAVLANHCAEFIDNPASRAGILKNNAIHEDMVWAARAAGLRFILNVVLNGKKEIIHAVAGDLCEAHSAGCSFLEEHCGTEAPQSDIVITTNGGYPLDQNIYQAVKGMTAAEAVVRPGGVIIMMAQSGDGHGGEAFCREMEAGADMKALYTDIMKRGRNETRPDQWQAQIMIRVLQRAQVVYVSDAPDELVRRLHMVPAHSAAEALAIAEGLLHNANASVTAIPDGVSVIVHPKGNICL